jgi:hypothetical protein
MTVAMLDGTNLYYFLTNQPGLVIKIADARGALLAGHWYMLLRQVRTDVGEIT